ncbi:MAG: transaldolase [Colwellia sp.]|nr:transaldolase [Colwellia sp.]
MKNSLERLSQMSTVVADTGDIEAIKRFSPEDATTNPSLLYKAAQLAVYEPLLLKSLKWAQQQSDNSEVQVDMACDKLAVLIGKEISHVVPGRVSTEVDARLSFNTQASINKALSLIEMYEEIGVKRDRVLIKLAATWEGIKAAEVLEQQNIQCNLTLLFNFTQARACAEANVFLISPFVGRIYDWFKKDRNVEHIDIKEDPGVNSVIQIYNYYKSKNYPTVVMAASFRTFEQVLALSGCDRLTISPDILAQLESQQIEFPQVLNFEGEAAPQEDKLNESQFRWALNQDAMATEKLAEGIRSFAADQKKLESLLRARL